MPMHCLRLLRTILCSLGFLLFSCLFLDPVRDVISFPVLNDRNPIGQNPACSSRRRPLSHSELDWSLMLDACWFEKSGSAVRDAAGTPSSSELRAIRLHLSAHSFFCQPRQKNERQKDRVLGALKKREVISRTVLSLRSAK